MTRAPSLFNVARYKFSRSLIVPTSADGATDDFVARVCSFGVRIPSVVPLQHKCGRQRWLRRFRFSVSVCVVDDREGGHSLVPNDQRMSAEGLELLCDWSPTDRQNTYLSQRVTPEQRIEFVGSRIAAAHSIEAVIHVPRRELGDRVASGDVYPISLPALPRGACQIAHRDDADRNVPGCSVSLSHDGCAAMCVASTSDLTVDDDDEDRHGRCAVVVPPPPVCPRLVCDIVDIDRVRALDRRTRGRLETRWLLGYGGKPLSLCAAPRGTCTVTTFLDDAGVTNVESWRLAFLWALRECLVKALMDGRHAFDMKQVSRISFFEPMRLPCPGSGQDAPIRLCGHYCMPFEVAVEPDGEREENANNHTVASRRPVSFVAHGHVFPALRCSTHLGVILFANRCDTPILQ